MNTMQVKYFLTLCTEKSFSGAAKKLYVTQPSFSQFIKKIETEVGAELVDRSCTPIKLTAAGEAYRRACAQFSAIEEDMNNEIANLSELKSGRLVVGATPFRASTMLSKSIACFKREYSGVDISIAEGSLKLLENGISGGEIDLAICSGEFDENVFHKEILSEEKIYIAAADIPEYEALKPYRLEHTDITGNSLKLLKTPPCPTALLARLPYIKMQQGESIYDISKKIFAEAGVSPKAVLSAENLYTAMSFVREGLGFMLCPDTMIKYGNINVHPYYYAIDSKLAVDRVCLITRNNRYLSRAAAEYSKILKQLIQSGTWRI